MTKSTCTIVSITELSANSLALHIYDIKQYPNNAVVGMRIYCIVNVFVGAAGSEEGYRPRLRHEDPTQGWHAGEGTGGARSSRARCPGRGWPPVGRQDVL